MFAEIYYGAKWNSETNELEQTEETALYRKTNLLDFSQYLGSFKNMEYMHHLISQGTTPRIKRDKEGLLAKAGGVEGFGKDMYQRYKRVVEAYNEPNAENIAKGVKPIVGKKLTAQEKDTLRAKKREFTAKPAEMEQKWRENFYNQPYIEKWVEVMQDNLIETWNSTRSGIARVFLINNLLNPIEFKKLTIGLATEPDEKRIKRLKEIVAIWKRWNSRYDTPQSFYEEKWIDQKYDKKEELEFPDGIYDALKDFPERDHKGGLERKFDAKQSEETARKAAADYLVAFITNAPEGSWSISDVKVGTMLSRKTATPAFAEHGSKIDDKQVREALKFLETGKIHVWQPKLKDGKKTKSS